MSRNNLAYEDPEKAEKKKKEMAESEKKLGRAILSPFDNQRAQAKKKARTGPIIRNERAST